MACLSNVPFLLQVSRPTAGVGPDAFPRAEGGGGGGASPLQTGGPPKVSFVCLQSV